MKSMFILFIICTGFFVGPGARAQSSKNDSVVVIPEFKYLFRYQNFYLGGQPTYETLIWLKSHGVKRIVNLRTERENSDFSGNAFDEVSIARKAGFEYYSVPVDGTKDYTPGKLEALANLLGSNDSILIHCASGIRATDFFMAYLVKNKGYTINDAVDVGRKLRFTLPFEKLLDAKVSLNLVK